MVDPDTNFVESQRPLDEVLRSFRKIIRAIELHSRDLMSHFGLTGPQLTVMQAIDRQEGVTVGHLGRLVQLSQATVTGILARLERQGYVRRTKSRQDRRRSEAFLTQAGRELLAKSPPLLQENFAQRFNELQPWEQTQILSVLQRLVSLMQAERIDAAAFLHTGQLDSGEENISPAGRFPDPNEYTSTEGSRN
jgi:DNA-binding MarR family transcriptional regulator